MLKKNKSTKMKNKKMIFSSLKKNTVFKKGRFGHFIFKARARALTARRIRPRFWFFAKLINLSSSPTPPTTISLYRPNHLVDCKIMVFKY